jgi:DNA-binding transcriptional LysR family regulator
LLAAGTELGGTRRGEVRIGTGPTFGGYVLPRLLEKFRSRYPQIDLTVDSGHTAQLVDSLQNGRLDLTFLVSPSAHASLVVERQWKFEVIFVVAAGSGAVGIREIPAMRDLPFILYKQGTIFEELIERYLQRNGLSPRVTMRLDNAELIKAMIGSGFGISMLPAWTVKNELKTGTLKRIRVKASPLEMRVALIRRRSDYVSAAVKAFLELSRQWNESEWNI